MKSKLQTLLALATRRPLHGIRAWTLASNLRYVAVGALMHPDGGHREWLACRGDANSTASSAPARSGKAGVRRGSLARTMALLAPVDRPPRTPWCCPWLSSLTALLVATRFPLTRATQSQCGRHKMRVVRPAPLKPMLGTAEANHPEHRCRSLTTAAGILEPGA
jgi:hypothetical protein